MERLCLTVGHAAAILALAACTPASPQVQASTRPAPASSVQVSSPTLQSGATGEASDPGLDVTKPINADTWTSSNPGLALLLRGLRGLLGGLSLLFLPPGASLRGGVPHGVGHG